MTVKKNQILLWIFLISTFMNGVVWEGVGWIALLLIAFNEKGVHNSSVLNFNEAKVLSIILFVVIYVAIQVNLLRLNSVEIIRLYGISKTAIAFLIVYFFLNRYISKNDILMDILPLMLILDLTYIIYLVTGYEAFNLIGGSRNYLGAIRNYLGAINVLFIPYILKFIPKRKKIIKIIGTAMIILIALFIGSRTTLAMTVAAILATGLLEKGAEKKIKIFFALLLFIPLSYIMLPIIGKNANFSRAFSVFVSIKDQARVDLIDSMWDQYNNYSNLQQLVGSGNNLIGWREAPPHNFVYELLLCYGKIGTSLFLLGVVITIIVIVKSKSINKRYCLLIIGMALIIGLVQPFITSGYFFQCLVGMVTLGIFYKGNSDVRGS